MRMPYCQYWIFLCASKCIVPVGNGQVAVVIVVLCVSGVSLVGGGLFQITRITDYAETDLQPCEYSVHMQCWQVICFCYFGQWAILGQCSVTVPKEKLSENL